MPTSSVATFSAAVHTITELTEGTGVNVAAQADTGEAVLLTFPSGSALIEVGTVLSVTVNV